MTNKDNNRQWLMLSLVGSLTLGLAPFSPEPHVWGKLKWLAGGGNGMALMDYLDLLMHGAPWLALGFFLVKSVLSNKTKP